MKIKKMKKASFQEVINKIIIAVVMKRTDLTNIETFVVKPS